MNRIPVEWKLITMGLPQGRPFADDRAPTIEEIRQTVKYPERRIPAIVYTMCSCGMRLEAWDYLKWKHITPIRRDGSQIVAAKIVIYAGDREQYISFITPEAYAALEEWMKFREKEGEKITPESWVMRDKWDCRKRTGCNAHRFANTPKQLKSSGIKRLVEDAWKIQGIRPLRLPPGKRRHEFQANHGFRKFFKTRCEQAGINSLVSEKLMNHSTGVTDSYYRATEEQLLNEYLKAVDALTINESTHLKREKEQLEEKLEKTGEFKAMLDAQQKQIEEFMKKQEQADSFIQHLIDTGQLKPRYNNNNNSSSMC